MVSDTIQRFILRNEAPMSRRSIPSRHGFYKKAWRGYRRRYEWKDIDTVEYYLLHFERLIIVLSTQFCLNMFQNCVHLTTIFFYDCLLVQVHYASVYAANKPAVWRSWFVVGLLHLRLRVRLPPTNR
ncbi:hypothetical protein TNCV_3779271 [Trichonephila clavipes]|nr:hypothetical protein TNCV_3779271 [Trichonephila clavipes]